jgi:subfamily B ATP-binding cassette protein MsbA
VQTLSAAVINFSAANANWPAFRDCLDYVAGFSRDDIASAMRTHSSRPRDEAANGDDLDPPDIQLHAVTFAYPASPDDVIRGLSVDLEKGTQLAIVGPSGCGKSTLLALILGLHEPKRGEVRIGGRSPAAFFGDPRARIGYVGAEAFLIAGTIRENMRYGVSRSTTDADLWAALEKARLRTTVEELPSRLEYRIEEDGSGLSAGQKQRLCLARALLNRPQLLVLDEASANLDADTEREITESLRSLRGDCTTLVVSHREGILQYADRTLTLDAGKPSA